jgi:fengycin family lipopeptide synthetase D
VFKTPTIRGQALYIKKAAKDKFAPIEPTEKKEFYELSYDQKRLWFIHQLEPRNPAYNLSSIVQLPYRIKVELLKKTLNKLLERHDSFRTYFKMVDDDVVQFVIPNEDVEIPLKTIDLSSLVSQERKQKRKQLQTELYALPFDLRKAPLLNLVLLKLSEEQYELLYNMHHIISDGWSMELLKQEFISIYESYKSRKHEPNHHLLQPLPPLRLQYKDFARWHNQLLSDKEWIKKAKELWNKELSGTLPVVNLPFDSYKKVLNTKQEAIYRMIIPENLTNHLRNLAKQNKSSLFVVLLSGFHLLISRLSLQDDIIIGVPAAGREHVHLKSIVGFFVNTLIFRNKIDLNEKFSHFLERVHKNVLQVLDYQGYPLELACSHLKIKYPEISVLFNMLNMGDTQQKDLENTEPFHFENSKFAEFDISCQLREFKNGIDISFHYYRELFKPTTIERIMQLYVTILTNISRDQDKKVTEYFKSKKRQKITRH